MRALPLTTLSSCLLSAALLLASQQAPGKPSSKEMAMVKVPGGFFRRGSTPTQRERAKALCKAENPLCREDFSDEGPSHLLYLSTFWIDPTEVTQGAYHLCVDAGACAPPAEVGQPYHDDFPVVGVTWKDAATYCAWAGKRLPTEAEWEKAARGVDGRIFPWGDVYDPLRLNHGQAGPLHEDASDGAFSLAKVGSYPEGASPYGALDMSGNVWEWVADEYYQEAYLSSPTRDPKGPAGTLSGATGNRVVRGGSFLSLAYTTRAAYRGQENEETRAIDIGFRCARSANAPN